MNPSPSFKGSLSCIISMHRGCNLHSRIWTSCCFSHLWTLGKLCIVRPVVSGKRFGLSDDFSRLSFLDFSFYSHFSRKVFEIRKGGCRLLIFFFLSFFLSFFFCHVVQNLPCHGRWIYSKFLLQCYLSAIVKDREKVSREAICRHIFSYLLTVGIKFVRGRVDFRLLSGIISLSDTSIITLFSSIDRE